MDKVLTFEQVQGFVREIKARREGYITNFFWDENKHPYWLDAGKLEYAKCGDCYILSHQNQSFVNLFYIATCMGAVANALRHVSLDQDTVIDVICRNQGEGEVDVLKSVGFDLYRHLFRMSHIGTMADDTWELPREVVFADLSDTQTVYDSLHESFDPLCEQLPSFKEVADYIQKKQVLVIKEKQALCGFLIYEMAGSTTWYLRYWYTSPSYRDKMIGSKLLRSSLTLGRNTKRQQLWVVSDNQNAINRYEHYGFRKESMNDYVMIRYK